MSRPLQIGCIGAGGYAASLIKHFDRSIPQDRARLAVISTSRPDSARGMAEVQNQKSELVNGVDELLARRDLDGVIIPTSIDSHLPYTLRALEAGLHVFCEKPITATVQEAREMQAAQKIARRIIAVGYQDTYSASVQWANRLINENAIGKIKSCKVWATWPRDDRYYNRNDWAGRIERDGCFVLDSPVNNALAHQINLMLYLTGPDLDRSNRATAVEAELYRAREIENYDTGAIRCETASGVPLLILLTHACYESNQPTVDFIGETGTIRRVHPHHCELIRDGQVVDATDDGEDGAHGPMFTNWLDAIQGLVPRVKSDVQNALEVTRLVNAASEAVPVRTVGSDHVELKENGENNFFRTIPGIEELFGRCFADEKLPSELGAAWTSSPGRLAIPEDYVFGGPARA